MDGIGFTYQAEIKPLGTTYKGEEGFFAAIYLIDESVNKNRWRVTREAKLNALRSVIGMPLLSIEGHDEGEEVGEFIDAKTNGRVVGIAKIFDEDTYNKIKSGEWRYTSPQILATKVTCSLCNADILHDRRHQHVVSGFGHEIIGEFRWEHQAYVENPAFTNTKTLSTCEGDENTCSFLRSLRPALTASEGITLTAKDGGKNMDDLKEALEIAETLQAENKSLMAGLHAKIVENHSLRRKVASLEKSIAEINARLDTSEELGRPEMSEMVGSEDEIGPVALRGTVGKFVDGEWWVY